MDVLEEIKQINEKLSNVINRLRRENFSSQGKSRLVVRGNELYMSVEKGGYKYLDISKLPLAANLAQERYFRNLLELYEEQAVIVARCIRALEKTSSADSIFDDLPNAVKKLVSPDVSTPEGYAARWQETKFNCKQPPENSPYYTAKGEHVRSKSEVIIADRLNANGIPYHYEAATSISGFGLQYPDFMVLNKRTGKVMFWEHFGMMEDVKYCRETIQKLENFAADGCVLGRDLIVSFESAGKPISTKHIDKLIEDYLK